MKRDGVYRARVVNNSDVDSLRRLQLQIPTVYGDAVALAVPSQPASTAPVPMVGSLVWVLFEEGDVEYPVWLDGMALSSTPPDPGGGGTDLIDASLWGQITGVTVTSTMTVVSLVAPANFYLLGMIVTGTGDAYVKLEVASTVCLSGRTNATSKSLELTLGTRKAVTAGQTVTVVVTNEASGTADYDATILGGVSS